MSQKDAHEAVTRHGAEHCARVVALVNVKRDNGDTSRPKRLLRHLLSLDAADVDFQELDDHEEAQEFERQLEEDRAKQAALHEEGQRRFAEARERIERIPAEDRDAWKALIRIKFTGNTCTKDDPAGSIMFGELVARTPDVHAALAEAQAAQHAERYANA